MYLEEIDFDIETPRGEVSYSDSDFAIQLIAGARYRMAEPWNLFAEVRYFDAGSVSLKAEEGAVGELNSDYRSTSLIFGVGYQF